MLLFYSVLGKPILSEIRLWLGANDLHNFDIIADEGWRWADGSPFNFINWASGMMNISRLGKHKNNAKLIIRGA